MALTDIVKSSVSSAAEQVAEDSNETAAKTDKNRQLQDYKKNQKAKHLEEQFKSQIALLKKLQDEYLELFKAFYRFNFQWPDKVEDFPTYEARYVNSQIHDLEKVSAKLKDKIDELAKVVSTINNNQNEKYNQLLKKFTGYGYKIIKLVEKISDYEAVQGNNNYTHRFKAYKPVAEAVQHLQYKLQFSLNVVLDEFINPGRLKPLKKQTTPQSIILPGDILRKIANNYLAIKDTVHIAKVAHTFFGISSSQINLEAKRRKLEELKHPKFAEGFDESFMWCDGKLYCNGKNEYGQLGLGDYNNRNIPTELNLSRLNLSTTDKIKQLVAGNGHSILLTEEGRCFVWGRNESGQLGLGDYNNRNIPKELNLKRLNLSATDKIKQVVAGSTHSILLTEEGRCFVWGRNESGQLGLGDYNNRNIPTELNLRRLNLSDTDKIKQLVAGSSHSILLTEQGRCFVWGRNESGQLGLGDHANRNIPVKLKLRSLNLSATDKITQVETKGNHNILVTVEGRCYVWGRNESGQLGLGDHANRNIPIELNLRSLNLSSTDRIELVAAGGCYNILVTVEHRWFVWRHNGSGQLGLGDNAHRNIPKEFGLTELDLRNLNLPKARNTLTQLVSGHTRNILQTDTGHCFVWDFQLNWWDVTPREAYYPVLNERRKLIKSIIDDIQQLTDFAFDKTDYGIEFKRMLLNKVIAYSSLYQPVINAFNKIQGHTDTHSLINALIKFGDFYRYFAANKQSTDQGIRLIDFVALLKILSSGEIDNKEKLADHINETAKAKHFKNRVELQFFGTSIAIPHISKRYYELGQSLLAQLNNNQIRMPELKLAADIFLQGLNNATAKNGMAYTLKLLLQTNDPLAPRNISTFR